MPHKDPKITATHSPKNNLNISVSIDGQHIRTVPIHYDDDATHILIAPDEITSPRILNAKLVKSTEIEAPEADLTLQITLSDPSNPSDPSDSQKEFHL